MKPSKVSNASVESVAIAKIRVGERRRSKLGGIAALAAHIERHGLIHPIVVTDGLDLVAGGRRLAAYERLGRAKIPARRIGDLDEDELRDLELGENVHRLDLTQQERDRVMVAQATVEVSREIPAKPGSTGGRPRGGNRQAARETGVDERTLRDAKAHVSALERDVPFFKGQTIARARVVEAAEQIRSLPAPVRKVVAEVCEEMVAQEGPKKAARIIEKVAGYKPAVQQETIEMVKSRDPEEASRGRARLMAVPPAPPHELRQLRDIRGQLDRLTSSDAVTPKGAVRDALKSMDDAIAGTSEKYQRLKESERKRLGIEEW